MGLQRLAEISANALDKKTQDFVFSNPWLDGVLQHDRHEQNLRL